MIGCGIVGNSLAYHLTRLGWTDIVQIDKGPLPNPGGSTGHASNFIFPVDHSKEMTQLTLESQRQYVEMGVNTECGGIEVARTEERMEELRRRMASAKSWGVDSARLVTPAEIKELVPYIDESILLGGFYCPTVSVVDSLRAGTIMRERGDGARRPAGVRRTPRSRRWTSSTDASRRVHTSRGTIEAEMVVIACGVWSPLLAKMAGAHIPLTPAVHQMIDVGPVPRFETSASAIEFPIVRDMDVFMYERQDGVGLEIGSYAHRSILHDPEEIPSIEEAALSPTEFPFTQADFGPQMEHALELMPEIVGDESVGREVRDQRPHLAHARRHADPRRDGGGEGPLVGGGGVGEGRPRRRQVRGRVDGERRVAHRPAHVRREPLPRPPEDARAREGANVRGVPEDVRHRAPGRAVGERARHQALADARAGEGARSSVLRGGRMGAPTVVRGERAARRALRGRAARGRVGCPLVVADRQRRAPRDARARRHLRPLGLRDLRRAAARARSTRCSTP